jgi:hypothetical protein
VRQSLSFVTARPSARPHPRLVAAADRLRPGLRQLCLDGTAAAAGLAVAALLVRLHLPCRALALLRSFLPLVLGSAPIQVAFVCVCACVCACVCV